MASFSKIFFAILKIFPFNYLLLDFLSPASSLKIKIPPSNTESLREIIYLSLDNLLTVSIKSTVKTYKYPPLVWCRENVLFS